MHPRPQQGPRQGCRCNKGSVINYSSACSNATSPTCASQWCHCSQWWSWLVFRSPRRCPDPPLLPGSLRAALSTRETSRHAESRWFLCSGITAAPSTTSQLAPGLVWGSTLPPSSSFNFFFLYWRLPPHHPAPPCSVSITGNNRPVVFHCWAWRRFPPRCHEVSAVPARQSAHLGDAAGGERGGAPAPAFSFPYGPRRRDLTHGPASLISESDTGWTKGPSARRSHWKDFYKPHKAANWQGPH